MSSPPATPPDEPTFCIDEALGGRVVSDALGRAGFHVERLIDHHPPGTEDAVWLADIGRRGWIVLTKVTRMRFRPTEQLAIVRHGVRAFALTGGNMRAAEMAAVFLVAMPAMRRLLAKTPHPFVAALTRSGTVALVYPKSTGSAAPAGSPRDP
ncbi:MAG: hypothetical protein HMLKMBBP_01412 [Planctomycetes bacterium]|nr:hypothetical protein [Planctomycetota bacterium]